MVKVILSISCLSLVRCWRNGLCLCVCKFARLFGWGFVVDGETIITSKRWLVNVHVTWRAYAYIDYGKKEQQTSERLENITLPRQSPTSVYKYFRSVKRCERFIYKLLALLLLTYKQLISASCNIHTHHSTNLLQIISSLDHSIWHTLAHTDRSSRYIIGIDRNYLDRAG